MRRTTPMLIVAACGAASEPSKVRRPADVAALSSGSSSGSAVIADLRSAPARVSTRLLASDVDSFAFTRDGKRVLYTSKADGLVLVDPDGRNKRQLAPTAQKFETSRDGTTVVYKADSVVYAVSLAGGAPVGLNDNPVPTLREPFGHTIRAFDFEITPDSKAVALEEAMSTVWLVPIGGGKPRDVLERPIHFRFTNDNRIVYSTYDSGQSRTAILDVAGGTSVEITAQGERPSMAYPANGLYGGLREVVDGAALVWGAEETLVARLDGNPVQIQPRIWHLSTAPIDRRGFFYHDPRWTLYYVDAATLQSRRLSRPVSDTEQVSSEIGSSGRLVVYQVMDTKSDRAELRLAALDGSFDRGLAIVNVGHVTPRLTRDDRTVVAHVVQETTIEVYAIAVDGSSLARLSPPGWSVDWSQRPYFEVGARHALVSDGRDLHVLDLP